MSPHTGIGAVLSVLIALASFAYTPTSIDAQQFPLPLGALPTGADTVPSTSREEVRRPGDGPHTFTVKSGSERPAYNAALLASFQRISEGAQRFALDMLVKFSDEVTRLTGRTGRDFMISPFGIWSLLMLLAEGADGNTLQELRTSLHLTSDQAALRAAYREVQRYLSINTTTIEVAALQALFTDRNQPPHRDYENIIERDYNSKLIPIDFHDPKTAADQINEEVRAATRGTLQYAVVLQDLANAKMLMLSSLFFKGQWKYPFNITLTRSEPFYDESGKAVGNVQMMFQELNVNYANMPELEGHVLELPYGKEDRLSMLIVLPNKGVPVNRIFHNLEKVGIPAMFSKLAATSVGYEDDTVEVFLPRFDTTTDVNLNGILEKMGIRDIFSATDANLSKISSAVYVSNVIHSTRIIVNEQGTTAAAITGAVLANKWTPPKFYLNRPFVYLIVEKKTNLLLFAGQLMNPNSFPN